ncbi:MAG: hypothetical protein R3D33_06410 [Hyphomicrobiaceae bacterium]
MGKILDTPGRAFLAGLVLAGLAALLWFAAWGPERGAVYLPGLAAVLLRFVHVLAGIVWVGFIWYVNFVQIPAIAELDTAGRGAVHRAIAPRAAFWFRHASTLTVVTGVAMIAFASYLTLGGIGAPRGLLITIAMLLGLVMWINVHMAIWPAMREVLGAGEEAGKSAARERVRRYARINLILAVPVTFAMVGAAHLY